MDFPDTKGRSLDCVLWLGMVMSALMLLTTGFIWDVCHLLPETSLSIPAKVCRVSVKKILKEFSELWNIAVYFMICYSCYEISSLQPIFSILCIPTFMCKEMRKLYSLTSFEVDELLPLLVPWEIRFPCKYLCGK